MSSSPSPPVVTLLPRQASRTPVHLFKLLMIGDSGVGKTSLLLRFADDKFRESHLATIGVDYRIKNTLVDGELIKLHIWDMAGQERFRTISPPYYRGTHGVVVVYDVTDRESFSNVRTWLGEIRRNCDVVAKSVVLVGNKSDRDGARVVDAEEARELAEEMGTRLFETSAKENSNVEEMFAAVTELVFRAKKEEAARDEDEAGKDEEDGKGASPKQKLDCLKCCFCLKKK